MHVIAGFLRETQCANRAQAGGGRGAGMEGRRRTAGQGGGEDGGD